MSSLNRAIRTTTTTKTTTQEDRWPLWLLSSAAGIAAAAVGSWLLFRRPTKFLTEEADLPLAVQQDGKNGSRIQVVRHLEADERRAIQEAFLAGDDFRWMTSGQHYKTNLNEKQHRQVTFQLVDYLLSFCERYGHLLVCRGSDGSFQGAIGLIPPYHSQRLFTLHFYRSLIPLGMPVALKMGPGPAARVEAFSSMETEHKTIMKGIPHWYVQVIGVAPTAQGQGVGRKLMEAAMALADRDNNTPMYLDCHNENVPFYEKLGFTVAKRIPIVPKRIQDDVNSTFEMNGMVRGL